jgi:hypothetical protein
VQAGHLRHVRSWLLLWQGWQRAQPSWFLPLASIPLACRVRSKRGAAVRLGGSEEGDGRRCSNALDVNLSIGYANDFQVYSRHNMQSTEQLYRCHFIKKAF